MAPDGNDGYAGTSPDQPWATLQHARTSGLGAGDTLFIMGGTYTNAQYFHDLDGAINGTEDNPLVFKAYGDAVAVFTSTGPNPSGAYYRDYFLFYIRGNDNIVIDGYGSLPPYQPLYLRFEGHEETHSLIKFYGDSGNYCENIVVRGVEIDGGHTSGFSGGSDDVGVGLALRYCRYSTFENNYIHHIHHPTGSIPPGDNTDELQGSGSGMYIFSCELITIDSNRIERCNHGSCELEIYRPSGHASRYCKITNNVIEQHYGGGIYLPINAHHNLVEGNVITHCGGTTTHPKSAILLSGSNNTIRNNVFHNPTRSGLVMAGQSVVGYSYIVENNYIYNNTAFGCGRSLNIVVKNTANPDCSVEDNILVNNIFYLSDYWNADGRQPEISIDVYQANYDHNWCDPDVAACVPQGTHWGGNIFHNNCIRRNNEGSAYNTLVVWGRDADCGGGFTDWSLDILQSTDLEAWTDNHSLDPRLRSESPDVFGLTSGWWQLTEGSPCIDAGIPVYDELGAYVESLYPGHGWGNLTYIGSAPDMGAHELGSENETPLGAPYINIQPTTRF